jgi:hypothetical protein
VTQTPPLYLCALARQQPVAVMRLANGEGRWKDAAMLSPVSAFAVVALIL